MAEAATVAAPAGPAAARVPSVIETAALLVALSAAVALRVFVGGRPAGESVPAALVFAVVLVLVSVAAGWRPALPRLGPTLVGGVAGAGLCLPPLARLLVHGSVGSPFGVSGYPRWATVVVIVAVAEEVMLRGALYDAVRNLAGDPAAVVVGAVVFAAMHVAFYGPVAIPLDSAVGLLLGCLRWTSGSVAAPAVAHSVADLAAWWLR